MNTFPYPSLDTLAVWFLGVCVLIFVFFIRRSARRSRHQRNQQTARRVMLRIKSLPGFPQKLAYLRKIDPFVFEEILLHAFEDAGFMITRNDSYTGDGGIDGRFYVNGHMFLIQAKRYSSWVSTAHIEKLEKQATQENCLAVFCHTGRTRKKTLESYRKHSRMMIISGESLISLIESDIRLANRLRGFTGC